MNTAYKHLEAKLRVGEFTVAQWGALIVGVLISLVWAMYVSPFSTGVTIFTAVYIGGLPAAAIFLATMSDTDIVLVGRAAVRWRRQELRYLAGPGPVTDGYTVAPERLDERRLHTGEALARLDLEELWES